MTAAIKQTMIDALSDRLKKQAQAVMPQRFRVKKCEGWAQNWQDRNGETIEFVLVVAVPAGQANHSNAMMLGSMVAEVMESNAVLGKVQPTWDKPADEIRYRACL